MASLFVEVFPVVDTSPSIDPSAPDVDLRHPTVSRKLLVVVLYVYNVPQEVLALARRCRKPPCGYRGLSRDERRERPGGSNRRPSTDYP